MSDDHEVVWDDPDTIKAVKEQAETLKDQAARAGIRFEVYLPPDLAEWMLDLVIDGQFSDPSESVSVSMGQVKDLDLHDDLKLELLRRFLNEGLKGDCIPGKEYFAELRSVSSKASQEAPAAWKPHLRLKVLNTALELANGDSGQAERWINTPLDILGNKTPLEYATNEEELTDLKKLVGRLKHGVFS